MFVNTSQAIEKLVNDGLVVIPTETVYGLAGVAESEVAISRIYKVKKRPRSKALILHILDFNSLDNWVDEIPEYVNNIATKYWPGPLTLILPKAMNKKLYFSDNSDSIAVRVPNHPLTLEILNGLKNNGIHGIVAPSANLFGQTSPTNGKFAFEQIGNELDSRTDGILDGGHCKVGIESTILDCTSDTPLIRRQGILTATEIAKTIGRSVDIKKDENHFLPGSSATHYRPNTPVFANKNYEFGDGVIAYSYIKSPNWTFRLASPKNNEEYAACLYESFHRADQLKLKRINIKRPTMQGIGSAINERIDKVLGL